MAYVGTPSYFGNDVNTLASILQGEAGGEGLQGLLAVADVIKNRANQNFSGYGSGVLDQALAKNQFQGQSRNPSPQALQVAQQLVGGKIPDVTGGALYYANPGASTASWARNLNNNNALQIGHHYFTNNDKGQPFTGSPAMADGPKGQEMYPPTMPETPGLGPSSQPNGIPQDVADYAASPEPKSFGDRLQGAFKVLADTPDAPPVRFRPMGDARDTGNSLLKALQATPIAQVLLKQRLG
jgi:hypothetical protein